MWREWTFLISSEKRMLRDIALLVALGAAGLTLITQASVHAMGWIIPAAEERLASRPPVSAVEPRCIIVMRSVLDDPVTTGSTGRRQEHQAACPR
jgi:hypothetical protein